MMPENLDPSRQRPPSSRAELIAYLAEGPRDRVEAWLAEALRGQVVLPDHRSDEPPYLAVLRIDSGLPLSARGDLRAACHRLVIALCAGDEQDVTYASGLLALAADLGVVDCAAVLAAAVREFPARPQTPQAIKKHIAGALLDLKVPQPAALWSELLAHEPGLAGAAFAGLLRTSPRDALAALPTLPDRSSLADSVTLTLEQGVAGMAKAQQDVFIPQLLALLPSCKPNLRATLDAWLEHAGYGIDYVAAPRAPHIVPLWRQNVERLTHALAGRNPNYQPDPAHASL